MTLYHMTKSNEMINSDHIIFVKFEPEHMCEAFVDEYNQQHVAGMVSARLEIHTAMLELDQAYSYEDHVSGTASRSVKLVYRGEEAEQLWEALERSAYSI